MKTHTQPRVKGSIASRGFTPEETNGHTLPARGRVIVMPSEEDRAAALDAFFGSMKRTNRERRDAAEAARPALRELCEVMRQKTGQSHIVRRLLWSLYNGEMASLIELVTLDWKIRQQLCAVLLAFGFEDIADPKVAFFYDAMKMEIAGAGLWTWFTEAGEQSEGVAA